MENNNFKGAPQKSEWYKQTWAIVLLLIVFFPVGIFLMWKYSNWNKVVKIVVSVIFALVVIGNMNGKKDDTVAINDTKVETKTEEPKVVEKTPEEIAKEKADAEKKAAADAETERIKAENVAKAKAEAEKEASTPTEYKTALKKAAMYSETASMSKKALYKQLISEYGEKFTAEAAQYAIDNLQADYKQNALKKAQTYQKTMSMSPSAIYDQLISEYGENFTIEEAQYAIDNLK